MFFIDYFGNRILIAVIGSIHVIINHPLAVGAYPLVVLMEWWGRRQNSPEWDDLAHKITFVLFIITTTLGALTGVGIWFATALIAPFGIGSLLRVFFWAWFSEWIVFISEVVLIMIYYLTWNKWREGIWKKLHIGVGVVLAVFSWLTMAIIVGILGFMMDSGGWAQTKGFFDAFLNPLYIPQLAFRTTYALVLAGLFFWFLIYFFTKNNLQLRRESVRVTAGWMLVWLVPFLLSALWYWNVVPANMAANVNVGMLTQKFMTWYNDLAMIMAGTIALFILLILIGAARPRLIPGFLLIIPFILGIWLLGHFERVREFIRKPYVVADYMYSNGVRVDEMPIFRRDGILPYATFVENHRVTPTNKIEAGRDVFLVACSRCHTTAGINGVVKKFRNLYGDEEWDRMAMMAFVYSMHQTRTYMPPFPGNDAEAEALVDYINHLRDNPDLIFEAHAGWTAKPTPQPQPVTETP